MKYEPILQAHRGVSTECPENTMPAFCAAIAQGYGIIELDPSYTYDNEIVVLHDKTIDRTARMPDGSRLSGSTLINICTLDEARLYDYGISKSLKFKGTTIPLLEDVLKLASDQGVIVKLDNKIEKFPSEASERLYSIIEKYEDTVALTTANVDTIKFYAERFPRSQLHYDGKVSDEILDLLSPYSSRLTVWMPYECEQTDWAQVPFANEDLCQKTKQIARLGIWIINDYESFDEVCRRFKPDIVETAGQIKPIKNRGKLFDMHTHSLNSLDSKNPVSESAKAAIEKGISAFALTDHCDIQFYESLDMPSHTAGSVRDAEVVGKEYEGRVKIFKGIELGESTWNRDATERMLNAHAYDVIIGSVHQLKHKDLPPYAQVDFSKFTDKELVEFMDEYFAVLEKTVTTLPCDILAHLTVPLRYINGKYNRNFSLEGYKNRIDVILQYIINHGIALEINTSGMGTAFDSLMPDREILERYKAMGGYLITIGSDAHVAKNLGNGFAETIELLRQLGFRNYFHFENRMAIQCSI